MAELRKKVELKEKGQSANLSATKDLLATLFWKTSVDLDLHCLYETKDGKQGHVYYGSKNHGVINLDKDSGVGGGVARGGNEENMRIADLSNVKHAAIMANIFSQDTDFARFGGKVTVKAGEEEFEVPLTEKRRGSWCTIAHLDNSGIMPQVKNINVTTRNQPSLRSIVDGSIEQSAGSAAESGGERRGLFGRLFG